MIALVLAIVVLAWAFVLRCRLCRLADAEHEARGALTALGLAVQRHGDAGLTAVYEGQLARVRAALGEPGAARCSLEHIVRTSFAPLTQSSPHCRNDGAIGVPGTARVAAGPAAVVLGNLVANAAEHGSGPAVVRIEVVNPVPDRSLASYPRCSTDKSPVKRGRGLRIAARAARAAGGGLEVREDGGRFAAVVELPVER